MATARKAMNGTAQGNTGLVVNNPALIVDLRGEDTLPVSETPEWVAKRYQWTQEVKRLERHLAPVDACLKLRTGEREVGGFLVNVSSFTVERVDSDACKALLGAKTPMKSSPTVRLSVVPA